jgi:hypothetical protein
VRGVARAFAVGRDGERAVEVVGAVRMTPPVGEAKSVWAGAVVGMADAAASRMAMRNGTFFMA